MNANYWRECLMGSKENIRSLREMMLTEPDISQLSTEISEINRDLDRTFPQDDKIFDSNAKKRIRNVLLWYSWSNPGLSYCQSYSFIAFVLYHVFNTDDAKHSMIDTYYSLYRLLLCVRPALPKSSVDDGPLQFYKHLENHLLVLLINEDRELYTCVKDTMILQHILLRGFSTYCLNWFVLEDCIRLMNFVVDNKVERIFQKLMIFLVSFLVVNRGYFIHFSEMTCLEFIAEKHLFCFDQIYWKAVLINQRNSMGTSSAIA